MADKTGIEWTEATWNPIAGCSVISPGCTNCYAMRQAGGFLRSSWKFAGLTQPSKAGPVWTGEVRFWPTALHQPLRWKKPRRIFVNSMSDLFHESVPDEWIDRVFAVMAIARQHKFQVLTKRAERMRRYLEIRPGNDLGRRWAYAAAAMLGPGKDIGPSPDFPLANVELGVSVEDQERDGRIRELLQTAAAVRWVSLEPLLGWIDLTIFIEQDPLWRQFALDAPAALDWVVLGGESGPGARPMHPDWARSVREQCRTAGVPFFFKQWGEWLPRDQLAWRDPTESFDGCEWTADHVRVGKKAAGRLLDGKTWDEYPRGVEMGTKANPGRFDCYAAARPDEEMFVLLARDPLAPYLVSIWSSVRLGDPEAARAMFEAMLQRFVLGYMAEPDADKASEALDCAMAMFQFQEAA